MKRRTDARCSSIHTPIHTPIHTYTHTHTHTHIHTFIHKRLLILSCADTVVQICLAPIHRHTHAYESHTDAHTHTHTHTHPRWVTESERKLCPNRQHPHSVCQKRSFFPFSKTQASICQVNDKPTSTLQPNCVTHQSRAARCVSRQLAPN